MWEDFSLRSLIQYEDSKDVPPFCAFSWRSWTKVCSLLNHSLSSALLLIIFHVTFINIALSSHILLYHFLSLKAIPVKPLLIKFLPLQVKPLLSESTGPKTFGSVPPVAIPHDKADVFHLLEGPKIREHKVPRQS